MIVKLVKIESSHNNTGYEYRGYAPHAPTLGETFLLYYGTPTQAKYFRSTPVTKIIYSVTGTSGEPCKWMIETRNSTYEVTVIDPKEVYPSVEAS